MNVAHVAVAKAHAADLHRLAERRQRLLSATTPQYRAVDHAGSRAARATTRGESRPWTREQRHEDPGRH